MAALTLVASDFKQRHSSDGMILIAFMPGSKRSSSGTDFGGLWFQGSATALIGTILVAFMPGSNVAVVALTLTAYVPRVLWKAVMVLTLVAYVREENMNGGNDFGGLWIIEGSSTVMMALALEWQWI